jgi:hypothetical protein
VNASVGSGNYNALFATFKLADWHDMGLQSNFTWGKALGTGASVQATSQYTVADPFDIDHSYGVQAWDRTFIYNMFLVYQPSMFKGQKGVLGHLLGGWTIAPIFSAASGLPLATVTSNFSAQSYGEGDGNDFFSSSNVSIATGPGENAVIIGNYNQGNSRHSNVPGSGNVGTGGTNENMFKDPEAVFNMFRSPILGLDTGHTGGGGNIRGLPFWNVDVSVKKAFNITERFKAEFSTIFTNVLNHNQMADPVLDLTNPGQWGVLSGEISQPRTMEFGLRVRF